MENQKILRPFVKWVGGKRGIIHELISRVPSSFNNYYEPFIGGGALFFELSKDNSFISDINNELITTYSAIKKDFNKVILLLNKHHDNHSEEYYYRVRSNYNISDIFEIAARMIYLNKACFNGLYRVNKNGLFNTSFGKKTKEKLSLYDYYNLKNISEFLQKTDIKCQSYDSITPSSGDFVFLDPPYDDTFTSYTDNRFGKNDQELLKNFFDELTKKGVFVMLTNSNTDFIVKMYSDYTINTISSNTTINRSKGSEVIITNYSY